MIVKSGNAQKRSFLGIDLFCSPMALNQRLLKCFIRKRTILPLHKHPNEQSGYVISGRYRIIFGDNEQVIGPSDSYSVPRGTEHQIEIITS